MEQLSNDHKDHPNEHENKHKVCDETEHSIVNLMESQWKLSETTTSEFPNGRKAIVEKALVSEERNKSKRAGL